jgi:6-phosphogluconolactonase (cycloisomerase 2 family)
LAADALGAPVAIAVSADGETLFVAHSIEDTTKYNNQNFGNVATYKAESGELVNPRFIQQLSSPSAVAVSPNGKLLFVASGGQATGKGRVGAYDATSGALSILIPNLTSPNALAVVAETNTLLVVMTSLAEVGSYDITHNTFKFSCISGLRGPTGITVAP